MVLSLSQNTKTGLGGSQKKKTEIVQQIKKFKKGELSPILLTSAQLASLRLEANLSIYGWPIFKLPPKLLVMTKRVT